MAPENMWAAEGIYSPHTLSAVQERNLSQPTEIDIIVTQKPCSPAKFLWAVILPCTGGPSPQASWQTSSVTRLLTHSSSGLVTFQSVCVSPLGSLLWNLWFPDLPSQSMVASFMLSSPEDNTWCHLWMVLAFRTHNQTISFFCRHVFFLCHSLLWCEKSGASLQAWGEPREGNVRWNIGTNNSTP